MVASGLSSGQQNDRDVTEALVRDAAEFVVYRGDEMRKLAKTVYDEYQLWDSNSPRIEMRNKNFPSLTLGYFKDYRELGLRLSNLLKNRKVFYFQKVNFQNHNFGATCVFEFNAQHLPVVTNELYWSDWVITSLDHSFVVFEHFSGFYVYSASKRDVFESAKQILAAKIS